MKLYLALTEDMKEELEGSSAFAKNFFMKKRVKNSLQAEKLIHFLKSRLEDASQANFDLSIESFLFIYSFVALKNA